MSSFLDVAGSLLPYHLMSFGALLGFQIYQSFIGTKLSFRHLPRPQFNQLQKHIFPVYFRSQVGLIILMAATHPPYSFASLGKDYAGLVALSSALAVDVLNLLVFGPRTTHMMVKRVQQETKDGRVFRSAEPKSPEMKVLDRNFSRNHAMVIHLNAVSMIATVFYGAWLSSRLHL